MGRFTRNLAYAVLWTAVFPSITFADVTIPAFSVSKDKNNNIVRYDVRVKADCTFADEPLDVYWLLSSDGRNFSRDDLNFIEKSYYRFVVKQKEATLLTGEVRALESRNKDIGIRISLKRAKNKCLVQVFGEGGLLPEEIKLSSIRLQKFNGEIPHEVAVIGKNKKSHSVTYDISL